MILLSRTPSAAPSAASGLHRAIARDTAADTADTANTRRIRRVRRVAGFTLAKPRGEGTTRASNPVLARVSEIGRTEDARRRPAETDVEMMRRKAVRVGQEWRGGAPGRGARGRAETVAG